MYALNKLLIHTQPAHLAAQAGLALGDAELPRRRAAFVRGVLAEEAGRRGGGPEAG
jgi:protein-arginine kinase